MTWKEKLSSKKFWCALIACIAAVGAAFGMSDGSVERITSIIGAFATLITYILVEGNIDAKRVESDGVDLSDEVDTLFDVVQDIAAMVEDLREDRRDD